MSRVSLKRLAIILPIVAILLAVLATPTMAQDSDPSDSQVTLEGYNVIKYDHSRRAPLKDAVRSIVQGKKVGNVCVFKSRLVRGLGQAPIQQRQLALNTETCESLVETGTPTEPLRRPLYSGIYRSSGSPDSTIAANEGRSLVWAWLLTDWYVDWRYYVRQETTLYKLLGPPRHFDTELGYIDV
jgi:hypothetical protein